jgi:rod shape determining protein RodA
LQGIDRRLIQNFEWPILTMGLLMAGVGIVNLVSAAPGGIEAGIPATAMRQVVWLGLGFAGMLAMLIPDYRVLERMALPIYLACVVLLVLVLMFAPVINGSQRWLQLGAMRLQPSELAKLAMLILFARLVARRDPNVDVGLFDLVIPALLIAVPAGLVLSQPDLGTALIIALVSGTFLLVSRVRFALLATLSLGAIGAATAAWFFVLHDYQKDRVLVFLDPDRDPLGSAYHSIQARIAVGSGGLLGKGWTKGPQSQLDFLPEQQTDFAFSVFAEEWGFVGTATVLLLYLGIMIRGLMIAHASKDAFGAYLAMGVVALLFWAGTINVGMVIGALPVVGVPLPFLSYGGSSLLTIMLALGLLMNISMRRYVF